MPDHSSIDVVTEILDRLYLGTVAYAQSLHWENPLNIEMVVNLCENSVPYSEGMMVEWIPVSDGEAVRADLLARALSVIDGGLANGRRLLVACRAGQSHSASIVIGYLRLGDTIGTVPIGSLKRSGGSARIQELFKVSKTLLKLLSKFRRARVFATVALFDFRSVARFAIAYS